ncbi:MAG: type II secretion system protein [Planctomycetota bacterium]
MKSKYQQSGFTLLEIIVVVTIMVLLAGAILPMAAQGIVSSRNDASREIVRGFADASLQFAADVLRAPATPTELNTNTTHIPGWNGPYTQPILDTTTPGTTQGGYGNDGFGRPILFSTISNVSILISSLGEDGLAGTADDIESTINITPILRKETLTRMTTINNAIVSYNSANLPNNPLPVSWTSAYNSLVSQNYLPSDSRYLYDAWGSLFTPDPASVSPVTKVKSPNMQAIPPSGN